MSDSTRVKADIIKYTSEYARTVRSWIETEQTAADLDIAAEYPPAEEIVDEWQTEEMTSYLLLSGNGPVAYAELWSHPIEMGLEIKRLLVDPKRRRNGYGCKMLSLLCEIAGRRKDIAKVFLTVDWDNRSALGCYLKSGFTVAGTTHDRPGLYLTRIVERHD
ncbi:MAG: GNAT family N-acetyltransferase [candidate division Zixibacteria bacterium]|nr:GNAT family N-acetyltransferase [candidate division Zixibacteria bacterium]